jgi:hemerythrin-like domain-containing protein
MKAEITERLVEEHRLILRMIDLLERNAQATAEGKYANWRFYLDGVEFIRDFADRFHHVKEEHVLFTALIKSGMPVEHSPVAVMLMEHEEGRGYVCGLEEAAREALAGVPGREQAVAENALLFAKLLRAHIAKEDGVLSWRNASSPRGRGERCWKGTARPRPGQFRRSPKSTEQ